MTRHFINLVCEYWKNYFPKRLSYNRFVEVMQSAVVPLLVYTMKYRVGKCNGISFIDSTKIAVCRNKKISRNKVFKGTGKIGKTTIGWFYGFKFHLTINNQGEILSFCLTPGNVDERDEQTISHLTKELFGKLFADKVYISGELFEKLWEQDIQIEHTRHLSQVNFFVNILSGIAAYSFLPKKPSLRLICEDLIAV